MIFLWLGDIDLECSQFRKCSHASDNISVSQLYSWVESASFLQKQILGKIIEIS